MPVLQIYQLAWLDIVSAPSYSSSGQLNHAQRLLLLLLSLHLLRLVSRTRSGRLWQAYRADDLVA
jgi:ABC-type branched-subunit amino acid transport system permease subunit